MCFGSKMKVPKPQPQQLQAPEPQLLEPPKGVEVGDGPADSDNAPDTPSKGIGSLTITPKGDGSTKAVAKDTGATSTTKSPAIKRALKR